MTLDQKPSAVVRPPDSIVVRGGTWSVLLPKRSLLVGLALALLLAAAVLWSVLVGSSRLTAPQALDALFGHGTRRQLLLVREIRLPRITAGLLAGAALGISGCLTQTLAHNRLATPDMLGIRDGATVGVMVTVLGTGSGMIGAWWAGPLGGAVAAAVVVLLAGGLAAAGQRFIVMGLAISTTLASLVDLALSSMSLHTSAAVYTWSIGSLNGRDYSVAAPVAIGLAALLPFALLAGRRLDVLRFDQDTSAGLGLHPARTRLFVLAVAVLLAGLGVGVGGPIGFVAMAAPVVASRFCGPTRVPVMASALLGALLVVLSDTLGRTAGTGAELPVGVVTSILGGPFLLWVLLTDRSARRF